METGEEQAQIYLSILLDVDISRLNTHNTESLETPQNQKAKPKQELTL